MIKHTISVSEHPARLKLRDDQLILIFDNNQEKTYACEDIGVLVLEHPAIQISSAVINALLNEGAVIIFCDQKHIPSGILLPVAKHTEVVLKLHDQIEAKQPNQKRLWQQIVQGKIYAQANVSNSPAKEILMKFALRVRSGDPDNIEAQASRYYWERMFPRQYAAGERRDPESDSLFNTLLNYGYGIVRASVARALVSAGLHPALGIHHHRRNNPFCLADDLMEPFRPIVDRRVFELLEQESEAATFCSHHRRSLLELLAEPYLFEQQQGPFMAILPRYIASFFRVLRGNEHKLRIPTFKQ